LVARVEDSLVLTGKPTVIKNLNATDHNTIGMPEYRTGILFYPTK